MRRLVVWAAGTYGVGCGDQRGMKCALGALPINSPRVCLLPLTTREGGHTGALLDGVELDVGALDIGECRASHSPSNPDGKW